MTAAEIDTAGALAVKSQAREILAPPTTDPVERREVDDPAAWDDLVRLLADLLYPATPDEPTHR